MPKMPGPDDIVLARRLAGYGSVRIGSDLPALDGWQPVHDRDLWIVWNEGECIPMRYEEAAGREDCEVAELAKET